MLPSSHSPKRPSRMCSGTQWISLVALDEPVADGGRADVPRAASRSRARACRSASRTGRCAGSSSDCHSSPRASRSRMMSRSASFTKRPAHGPPTNVPRERHRLEEQQPLLAPELRSRPHRRLARCARCRCRRRSRRSDAPTTRRARQRLVRLQALRQTVAANAAALDAVPLARLVQRLVAQVRRARRQGTSPASRPRPRRGPPRRAPRRARGARVPPPSSAHARRGRTPPRAFTASAVLPGSVHGVVVHARMNVGTPSSRCSDGARLAGLDAEAEHASPTGRACPPGSPARSRDSKAIVSQRGQCGVTR